MLRREGGQCWKFADKRESQIPSSSGAQAGSSVVEGVLVVWWWLRGSGRARAKPEIRRWKLQCPQCAVTYVCAELPKPQASHAIEHLSASSSCIFTFNTAIIDPRRCASKTLFLPQTTPQAFSSTHIFGFSQELTAVSNGSRKRHRIVSVSCTAKTRPRGQICCVTM